MITAHLGSEDSPLAHLARLLRITSLTLHGGPVGLAFVYPDGSREHYSLWLGTSPEDFSRAASLLNWSRH